MTATERKDDQPREADRSSDDMMVFWLLMFAMSVLAWA